MPLAVLGRYENVIWIVDQRGAQNDRMPSDVIDPTTLLRLMNQPGHVNTLALYAVNGGKVWLLGGGAALASLLPWNDRNNDSPSITFSAAGPPPRAGARAHDVRPGRLAIRDARVHRPGAGSAFGGRLEGSPTLDGLPEAMDLKTPATDPLPPLRSSGKFYRSVVPLEVLQAENFVIENGESTLDTLYRASGGGLYPPSVVPTTW